MWPALGLGAIVLLLLGSFGGGAVAAAADVPRWTGSLTGFVLAVLLSGLVMRQASARRPPESAAATDRTVGVVALGLGFAVLALTAASQTGLLGGQDFVLIAVAGLIAGVFCLIVALEAPSRLALLGAAMSALPVVLLAYFLLTRDG